MMPTKLNLIELGHNYLEGHIPSSIGMLSNLEFLDLSNNNLSGQVPSSLASLQSFTYLYLSYNQLSGPLPDLPRSVRLNVTGNPGLKNHTEDSDTPDNMAHTENDFR